VDEFSSFYKNICVPNTRSIDERFADIVRNKLNDITCNDTGGTDEPFSTVDLLCDCIQSLKLSKAAGHNDITNEHIIFSSNDFVVHTCLSVVQFNVEALFCTK